MRDLCEGDARGLSRGLFGSCGCYPRHGHVGVEFFHLIRGAYLVFMFSKYYGNLNLREFANSRENCYGK